MAIDIAAFTPRPEFTGKGGRILDYTKSSRRRPSTPEVLYPGEPEHRSRVRRLAEGIPIDPMTLKEIVRLGRTNGVRVPAFD